MSLERVEKFKRVVRSAVFTSALVVTPATAEVVHAAPTLAQEVNPSQGDQQAAGTDTENTQSQDVAQDAVSVDLGDQGQTTENQTGISSDPNTGYNQSFEQDYQNNLKNPDPRQSIADLRPVLTKPYLDKDFSMSYSPSTDTFTIVLMRGHADQADTEIASFLAKHNLTLAQLYELNAKIITIQAPSIK